MRDFRKAVSGLELLLEKRMHVILSLKLVLEYSCFTRLCYFLLCSRVNQLYIHISLFLGFPSHSGHHGAPSRVFPRGQTKRSFLVGVGKLRWDIRWVLRVPLNFL